MFNQKKTYRISLLLLGAIALAALGAIVIQWTTPDNGPNPEWIQQAGFPWEKSGSLILSSFIALGSFLVMVITIKTQQNNNTLFLRLAKENQLLEHQVKVHDGEKNSFLSIVAHDLKSPLNGILGLLNLIKFSYNGLNSEQREYLQYINQSVMSMQRMINNLLDINRIEQGKNVINLETIALSGLLERHIRIFKACADKKNITLILEDNAPSVALTTDTLTLTRILENLVSNAIKFSPRNKEVLIRVIHNNKHIKLEVIDQGPGIKKEEMSKLFVKYQRLSARPTGGENSTGLGLSIVKELVASLQGKISVESEENKGAKFTVELPLVLN